MLPGFILNNIEWVLNMYTLLFLSGKKTKKKYTTILKNPLYLVYCNVSRPLTLRNVEITLLYLIVHVFILYSICTKMPNTIQIFWEMFKL